MSSLETAIAALPTRSEWNAAFAAVRADIKAAFASRRPRPSYRVAAGPRIRGFAR